MDHSGCVDATVANKIIASLGAQVGDLTAQVSTKQAIIEQMVKTNEGLLARVNELENPQVWGEDEVDAV
jgi:hypothetical protein